MSPDETKRVLSSPVKSVNLDESSRVLSSAVEFRSDQQSQLSHDGYIKIMNKNGEIGLSLNIPS